MAIFASPGEQKSNHCPRRALCLPYTRGSPRASLGLLWVPQGLLFTATLKGATTTTIGGHGPENMLQEQDEQAASPSNYKGFVAGVFSGIGKLSGEPNCSLLRRATTKKPHSRSSVRSSSPRTGQNVPLTPSKLRHCKGPTPNNPKIPIPRSPRLSPPNNS